MRVKKRQTRQREKDTYSKNKINRQVKKAHFLLSLSLIISLSPSLSLSLFISLSPSLPLSLSLITSLSPSLSLSLIFLS
jgi:hypothetical protein